MYGITPCLSWTPHYIGDIRNLKTWLLILVMVWKVKMVKKTSFFFKMYIIKLYSIEAEFFCNAHAKIYKEYNGHCRQALKQFLELIT